MVHTYTIKILSIYMLLAVIAGQQAQATTYHWQFARASALKQQTLPSITTPSWWQSWGKTTIAIAATCAATLYALYLWTRTPEDRIKQAIDQLEKSMGRLQQQIPNMKTEKDRLDLNKLFNTLNNSTSNLHMRTSEFLYERLQHTYETVAQGIVDTLERPDLKTIYTRFFHENNEHAEKISVKVFQFKIKKIDAEKNNNETINQQLALLQTIFYDSFAKENFDAFLRGKRATDQLIIHNTEIKKRLKSLKEKIKAVKKTCLWIGYSKNKVDRS